MIRFTLNNHIAHGPIPITNEEDRIYSGPSIDGLIQSNTGKHLMLNLVKDKNGEGYTELLMLF